MTNIPTVAESHQNGAALTSNCPDNYRMALAGYPKNVTAPKGELYFVLSPIIIVVGLFFFQERLYGTLTLLFVVPVGIFFADLRGDIRRINLDLLNTMLKQIKKLEEWSGHSFSSWSLLNEDEVRRAMNHLMLEVVRPVYDLQKESADANPLEWKDSHAELMRVVNKRFDMLKFFGYMPQGGYGLFFQHVRHERDNEPEKYILAV